MSKLLVRSNNAQLEIPSSEKLEITKGSLNLTLSFNDNGGFSLTQIGMVVASVPATPAQAPTPGTVMPDGTVYAGISPDTGKAFYAAAQDVPPALNWIDAMKFAPASTTHGHKDWRVPTKDELKVLFDKRAAIGGFDLSGSFPSGWYWSSSDLTLSTAQYQNFSDGYQHNDYKGYNISVRLVRG